MEHALTILKALADPRGRASRKGLVVLAVVLVAAELMAGAAVWLAGIGFDHPAAIAVKVALIWSALAAAIRRLHDIGRSAWMLAAAAIALVVWAFVLAFWAAMTFTAQELMIGGTGFALVFAGLTLPMLGALVWLHVAPGEDRANRHGPVPDGLGFSQHANRQRQAPAGGLIAG